MRSALPLRPVVGSPIDRLRATTHGRVAPGSIGGNAVGRKGWHFLPLHGWPISSRHATAPTAAGVSRTISPMSGNGCSAARSGVDSRWSPCKDHVAPPSRPPRGKLHIPPQIRRATRTHRSTPAPSPSTPANSSPPARRTATACGGRPAGADRTAGGRRRTRGGGFIKRGGRADTPAGRAVRAARVRLRRPRAGSASRSAGSNSGPSRPARPHRVVLVTADGIPRPSQTSDPNRLPHPATRPMRPRPPFASKSTYNNSPDAVPHRYVARCPPTAGYSDQQTAEAGRRPASAAAASLRPDFRSPARSRTTRPDRQFHVFGIAGLRPRGEADDELVASDPGHRTRQFGGAGAAGRG